MWLVPNFRTRVHREAHTIPGAAGLPRVPGFSVQARLKFAGSETGSAGQQAVGPDNVQALSTAPSPAAPTLRGGGAGGLALALTPALCWFRGAHLPLACGPPFFWKSGWCLQGPEKCLLGKQVNRVQLHVCRVETGPHLESVNSDYLKNSRNTRVVQQREG